MVYDIIVKDGDTGEVVAKLFANSKTFSSGSIGYYGQDKLTIDGVRYQAQVQLVAIGSKPV